MMWFMNKVNYILPVLCLLYSYNQRAIKEYFQYAYLNTMFSPFKLETINTEPSPLILYLYNFVEGMLLGGVGSVGGWRGGDSLPPGVTLLTVPCVPVTPLAVNLLAVNLLHCISPCDTTLWLIHLALMYPTTSTLHTLPTHPLTLPSPSHL